MGVCKMSQSQLCSGGKIRDLVKECDIELNKMRR